MLNKKLFLNLFFLAFCISKFCDCKKNKYNGGLVFYDPISKYKILPPIVTSLRYMSLSRSPIVRQPCACRQSICGCCAGMNIPLFNFNRMMCANITFDRENISLKMELLLDGRALMMYSISPQSPPPFCIPVPLPIPVGMCLKLYNIKLIGNNISSCMDWVLRIFNNNAMVLHFACVKVGQDGVNFSRPGASEMAGGTNQEAADVYDPVELDRKCYI